MVWLDELLRGALMALHCRCDGVHCCDALRSHGMQMQMQRFEQCSDVMQSR